MVRGIAVNPSSPKWFRAGVLACLSIIACLAGITPARAQSVQASPPAFVEGVVIVGFRPGATASDRASARRAVAAVRSNALSRLAPDAEVLQLPAGARVDRAIKALQRNPAVRYAEPNYILTRAAVSDDPDYTANRLWGMYGDATTPVNAFGSQAGEAWAAGYTGSRDIYIGVIDEGIDVSHPDLADNIWNNPFDLPGDGVDNDGNGFVDDVHGWDFVSNDNSVYDGSGDDHGTHVAGTIGGVGGNGVGVAGVSWNVRMISAKFLGANGGTTDNAVRAVDYITDLKLRHGLNIVATSNSWGGGGFSQALLDAIVRGGNADILFIAAAGNSSSNNDAGNYYPSNYQCNTGSGWDCVISVAATTSSGGLASFSSYGLNTVDIGAPGSDIRSTLPGNTYGNYSGTSMATPHVSGAAALCASIDPLQSGGDLRAALLSTAAATTSLEGRTVTGGRLDVGAMAGACLPPTSPVDGAPSGLSALALSRSAIQLDWTDGSSNESGFEIQRAPGTCEAGNPFLTVGSTGPGSSSYTAQGLSPDSDYCFRVRAFNRYQVNGERSVSSWSQSAAARTQTAPAPYQCSLEAADWIDTSSATNLGLGDDAQASATMPFAFPFYGTPVSSLRISSNGFVRLDGGTATAYANSSLPSSGDPNGLLAPLWDDLNPAAGGTVKYLTTGSAGSRRFVVSWEDVPHYNVAGSAVSFQLVLEEATGHALFVYRDVFFGNAGYDRGASATVGIEEFDGSSGTQVSFNSASLSDATAWRCSAGSTVVAPPAPSGVSATATSTTEVSLSWNDNSTGETGFVVERMVAGGSWATIANAAADAVSHVDSQAAPGTSYSYRVFAVNGAIRSAASNVATVTTPDTPPAAPTGLAATATGPTQVSLSWTDVATDETGYQVHRTLSGGGSFVKIADLPANAGAYLDSTVTAATAYDYKIVAVKGLLSAQSGVVSVTTPQPPQPPAAPSSIGASVSAAVVTVTWSDLSNNESSFEIGRQTYNSKRRTWSATTIVGSVSANTASFANSPGNGTYRYLVRAVNVSGASAWAGPSSSVVVNTRNR